MHHALMQHTQLFTTQEMSVFGQIEISRVPDWLVLFH